MLGWNIKVRQVVLTCSLIVVTATGVMVQHVGAAAGCWPHLLLIEVLCGLATTALSFLVRLSLLISNRHERALASEPVFGRS